MAMRCRHATDAGLPPTFCVSPFVAQHVDTLGRIKPCCEFAVPLGKLPGASLAEAWGGETVDKIRQAFLAGEMTNACTKCIEPESAGETSLRLLLNAEHAHWLPRLAEGGLGAVPETPVSLDIRSSNICNFKCRICSHHASSKWFSDATALGMAAGDRAEVRSFPTRADALAEMGPMLDRIEHIYFAGGEPLLMPEHYAVLDALIERGRRDVALAYNSNLSVLGLGRQEVLPLWARFSDIRLEASIDAVGARGALVRHGFDWAVFRANLARIRETCPHVRVSFGVTVSALTVAALDELIVALVEACGARPGDIHVHSLHGPLYLRTQVLPAGAKREARRRIAAVADWLAARFGGEALDLRRRITGTVRFMEAADMAHEQGRLARHSLALDRLRGERTAETLPELAPILARAAAPAAPSARQAARDGRA